MPASGRVNLLFQTLIVLVPVGDLFASYRIKKLRRYLALVWIPVIALGNLVPHLMGHTDRALVDLDGCEPNWALFLFLDTCDTVDLQAFTLALAAGTWIAAVLLIRRWSRRWNARFDQAPDVP